jgi:ribosomal protein S20
MSITPVSSSSSSQIDNPYADVRTDFKNLTDAIQNGDLASAQTAFQAIQQSGVTPPPNSPLAKDLTAIGQALSSNDVSAAQQALQQLQSDAHSGQAKGRHGHHHHHGSSTASTTDPTTPSVLTSTSSTDSSTFQFNA